MPWVLYALSWREIENAWKKRVRRSPLPLHAKIPAVLGDDMKAVRKNREHNENTYEQKSRIVRGKRVAQSWLKINEFLL